MYQIDESQLPFVIISFDSPMTLDGTHQMMADFDRLLNSPTHIGLIMVSDVEGQHEKGTAKLQKQWIQANRSRIKAACAGIAIVTQSNKFIKLYKPIANMVIQRMYGCPGALFTDLDEAKAWLQGLLNQSQAPAPSLNPSSLHS